MDTEIPISYFPGLPNSRAQVLNTAKIATIRTDGEIKLWGNELYWQTDGSLKFISVKRTLDHIIDSVVAGMQWAVDRKISARTFELVTQTVNEHLAKLVRQRIILGGQCFADSRNVKSTLTDGQAFFSLIFTPMYPMREINICLLYTSPSPRDS